MNRKTVLVFSVLSVALLIMSMACLFVGSSHMSFSECLAALFGRGSGAAVRIMQRIRLPRMLAALIAGAALSLSGLIMQTTLGNEMASPSTLGVSGAAVFGANVSIIAFAGGFLDTGHMVSRFTEGINPYATGMFALVFSVGSVLLILGLCRLRAFSPEVVVLSGIAIGAVFTAATTVLQFYATDVGLSAAVIWNFGDLGRATFSTDLIMLAALLLTLFYTLPMAWRYNALLSGDTVAVSLGVPLQRLRFCSLFLCSLITAVCVSFLGSIGFVGIICPHVAKKLLGQDHRKSIPCSALIGSLLLLTADTLSRIFASGSALPIGAITSLLGAPFFIAILFGKRRSANA